MTFMSSLQILSSLSTGTILRMFIGNRNVCGYMLWVVRHLLNWRTLSPTGTESVMSWQPRGY
jgi:hypothetical protein